jgi:hypothetical protein
MNASLEHTAAPTCLNKLPLIKPKCSLLCSQEPAIHWTPSSARQIQLRFSQLMSFRSILILFNHLHLVSQDVSSLVFYDWNLRLKKDKFELSQNTPLNIYVHDCTHIPYLIRQSSPNPTPLGPQSSGDRQHYADYCCNRFAVRGSQCYKQTNKQTNKGWKSQSAKVQMNIYHTWIMTTCTLLLIRWLHRHSLAHMALVITQMQSEQPECINKLKQ